MKIKEYIENYTKDILRDPFIIAEAGVNHEGSMELAKRLIDEAKLGAAHAIKFQTYKAETIASKDSPSYWDLNAEPTTSQHELFKKYDKFWEKEYIELKEYCDNIGIEFLSTAFDKESAYFLDKLMPAYKISSSDITNLPFIELQCSFGKPIILSTGASNIWEVQEAVDIIEKHGNDYCLMHCVLNYPTPNDQANLGMIRDLITKFPDAVPGYSDHTLPGEMDNLIDSLLLGAVIIEKHFTHDKTLPGNDHYHSMDKSDLKLFWQKWKDKKALLGTYKLQALPSEESARKNARRSLVATRDLTMGTTISLDDLTWKRPAHGISPKYMNDVLGKIIAQNIPADSVLKSSMLCD